MRPEQSIVPTLQILGGPLNGRLYKIDHDVMVIGRSPECDLVLQPRSISRRHAAIVRRNGEHLINDIGSTRGTFVNGQRLTNPVILQDGCTIQIGELILTFRSRAVQIQDGDDDQSTVFAAIDMTSPSDKILPTVKPEQKLRALQQISQSFGSTLELNELLERILAALFDIFPRSERGFVLLEDRESHTLVPEVIRTRTGPAGELTISKTILHRVLDNGQAILSRDVLAEFPNSDSVTDSRIRSFMCAPILDQKQKPIGVIQIDTRDGRGKFDQEDLDLLAAVACQISVAVQNAQLHVELLKQRELEQELQFARQVMLALLPEKPAAVAGYELWDYYEPARHVGGDYYGFIPLHLHATDRSIAAQRWGIAVGDVVGKGLPAALLTAKLSAEIRLFLQGETDPAQVVTRLNRQLDENGVLDMYITFLLVILDIQTHRLVIANAGHPPPLLLRRDGRVEELGRTQSGLPLAIQGDWVYESSEVVLAPEDVLFLYTDGVTDALNSANERFGDNALLEALREAKGGPARIGDSIVQKVRDHIGGKSQFDDITMVAFGRT